MITGCGHSLGEELAPIRQSNVGNTLYENYFIADDRCSRYFSNLQFVRRGLPLK